MKTTKNQTKLAKSPRFKKSKSSFHRRLLFIVSAPPSNKNPARAMNTAIRQNRNDRVAQNLSLMQEDALIGLMFEEFGKNDMKHLDYDKVRRFAVSLQTDPAICERLDCEAIAEDLAWSPPDVWITDMCMAFLNAKKEEQKKARDSAFGGPKVKLAKYRSRSGCASTKAAAEAPSTPVATAVPLLSLSLSLPLSSLTRACCRPAHGSRRWTTTRKTRTRAERRSAAARMRRRSRRIIQRLGGWPPAGRKGSPLGMLSTQSCLCLSLRWLLRDRIC